MHVFLVALLSTAPAAEDAQPRKLLILDFKHEKEDEQTARLLNDLIATAAARRGSLSVLTGGDIRNAIELEAEREALGCDDGGESCLAEIAGAMGADLVLFGNVGRLGELYLVTMNLFDSSKATSVGRESVRARSLEELPDKVEGAVNRLASIVDGGAGGVAGEPPPLGLWLGGTLAGLGAITSLVGFVVAADQDAKLDDPSLDGRTKEGHIVNGQLALWLAGVGGAALAVAGGTWAATAMMGAE